MTETSSRRIRVALLFGGRSGEHSISCLTAGSILEAIDRRRFEPVPVGITRDGRWTLAPDDPALLRLVDGRLPEVGGDGPEVLAPTRAGSSEWRLLSDSGTVASLGSIDVSFPLLHGPFGEDGTVQGLLELTDQRYVGAGVLASAVGMDKGYMKCVLEAHGLPVLPYVVVGADELAAEAAASVAAEDRLVAAGSRRALDWPVFVKPCRAGSSLGISKATRAAELADAIEFARRHDPRVLIEQASRGREIECAVLGSPSGRPPRASLPSEIVVQGGHEFYDFDAKYLDAAGADLLCPADLPAEATAQVQAMATQAYRAIGGEGLARVDFFYDPSAPEPLVVNEINTMPGFTPISQYPRMWLASGLSYSDLVGELIELALERPQGLR
ncbi:MAG: D-alanine--D-alanine ligase [Bifidobacteriaceae bacterium]|jgi:D-alanine-D-alanine ligase|nr:D-alanine--D-alanine ligase [Bifidobacteriaceae bacterium]